MAKSRGAFETRWEKGKKRAQTRQDLRVKLGREHAQECLKARKVFKVLPYTNDNVVSFHPLIGKILTWSK